MFLIRASQQEPLTRQTDFTPLGKYSASDLTLWSTKSLSISKVTYCWAHLSWLYYSKWMKDRSRGVICHCKVPFIEVWRSHLLTVFWQFCIPRQMLRVWEPWISFLSFTQLSLATKDEEFWAYRAWDGILTWQAPIWALKRDPVTSKFALFKLCYLRLKRPLRSRQIHSGRFEFLSFFTPLGLRVKASFDHKDRYGWWADVVVLSHGCSCLFPSLLMNSLTAEIEPQLWMDWSYDHYHPQTF